MNCCYIPVLRTLLKSILSLLILLSCSSEEKAEEVTERLSWIPFEWVGDTIGGRFFDKLAINLPFSTDNIPHQFSIDTGATSTTTVYGSAYAPNVEAFCDQGLLYYDWLW